MTNNRFLQRVDDRLWQIGGVKINAFRRERYEYFDIRFFSFVDDTDISTAELIRATSMTNRQAFLSPFTYRFTFPYDKIGRFLKGV